MRLLRYFGAPFACLAVLALASLNLSAGPSAAVGSGLENPGFESGVLDGLPAAWNVVQPVPDAVRVTDAEGPAEFPTYADMGNVTVTPYRGNLMLRLGSPKRSAENQPGGLNTVSQTFVAAEPTLKFALRAFSWEHRGNDKVYFDLSDGAKTVGRLSEPLTLTMPNGSTRTCWEMPCYLTMDVGSRGQYLDSGWREVEIVDVPVGVPLTLTLIAAGTNDNAHATWAYFDNVSSPPVAKFTYAPTPLREGDAAKFIDGSFDPDPEDEIVSWRWNINGETFDARNPVTILPDEGTYSATLTVTSSDGTSTTVSSGETALDGTDVPPLVATNAAPLVHPLDVEALAGTDAPVVARLIDQGWLDSTTATVSVGGSGVPSQRQEDNLPALSTGLVQGSFAVAGSATGQVALSDNDGGSSSASFDVTVVPDDPARHEPNGSLGQAYPLETGGSYLSYIQSAGDVDIFELVSPDGAWPAGTELLATLTDLPADYDLVIFSESSAGPPVARFAYSDFGQIGFDESRFAYSRFAYSRFAYSRFAYSRFAYSGAPAAPLTFSEIPLSQMGFTGLEGEDIGSTDIDLAELGLAGITGPAVRVNGFSANRGLDDEAALARTDVAGTRLFVAVAGSNGARSATPYRLQLETSQPPDLASVLTSEVCTKSPVVPAALSTSDVQVLYDNPGAAKTLIVTQRERMRVLQGMTDESWDALLADLTALAQHPAVQADVISLPSDIYDDWDRNPCDIDEASQVSADIKSLVQGRLPGVEYLVFVGDDDVIPHKRVPDETIISNERNYALDSFLQPGSPQFTSVVLGYNLTDDYYVDAAPTSWQGRELYLPDIATGRLVETPEQISAAVDAFLASNGTLNPQTAVVTGYDFFNDGAQAMAGNLGARLATDTLISDAWTADDLSCALLGLPSSQPACTPHDISAINAHFTHYSALSAGGFETDDFADALGSQAVAEAGGATPALAGTLVFSMGCHAGFNAPNRATAPADEGLGFDPSLDFVEAMAIQRAIYIASTGFGLGDDEGLGGTEKLLTLFSEGLVDGDVVAGRALVEAKIAYIAALSAPTVYDEKSAIQTVFYGLPMYRVLTGAGQAQPQSVAASAVTGLTLTTIDGGVPTTRQIPYEQVVTPSGSYFKADGDAQSTAGRPIQPRIVDNLTGGSPVSDVIFVGGSYTEVANFDPVIVTPTNEWALSTSEAQSCLRAFWPSELAVVNSLDIAGALRQYAVFTPAQFECTAAAGKPVLGVERLYDSLTMQLLRCETDDATPPVVESFDLRSAGSAYTLTLHATDESGIQQIIVLRIGGGVITPTIVDVAPPRSGEFTVDIAELAPGDELVAHVHDGCNVATVTGKGANLSPIVVNAGPDQVISSGTPNVFNVTIANFASLTAPVSYVFEFGDGQFASGEILPSDVTLDPSGTATLVIQHQYAPDTALPAIGTIKVTDVAGGIGVDDVQTRCDPLADPDCNTDSDGDGCTDREEIGPDPALGGRRNPLDPLDFPDLDGNLVITIADVTAEAAFFLQPPASPAKDLDGDRIVTIVDLVKMADQFLHSCVAPP